MPNLKYFFMAAMVLTLLCIAGCGSQVTSNQGVGNSTMDQDSQENSESPEDRTESESKPKDPIKVRLAHSTTDLSYLALYIADNQNFFEEEGIDLEIIPIQGGGGPEMNALLAGEVDLVGTNTPRLITLYNEGQPVVGIYNLLNRTNMNMAMNKQVAEERGLNQDSNIGTVLSQLDGLNFGISRAGALTHQFALYYASRAGLDPEEDIQVVAVGGGQAMIASLEQRKIDVFINSSPVPEQAELRGGIILINNSKGEDPEFDEFTQQLIVTSKRFADENPEAISRLKKALQRASEWGIAHSAQEVADSVKTFFQDMDEDLLIGSIENVKLGLKEDGAFTQKGIEANYEVLEAAGVLKSRPVWNELVIN